jgi:hypothetical protein
LRTPRRHGPFKVANWPHTVAHRCDRDDARSRAIRAAGDAGRGAGSCHPGQDERESESPSYNRHPSIRLRGVPPTLNVAADTALALVED